MGAPVLASSGDVVTKRIISRLGRALGLTKEEPVVAVRPPAAPRTDAQTARSLARLLLIAGTMPHKSFREAAQAAYSPEQVPSIGRPAAAARLQALEEHWGRAPSAVHRAVLEVDDGTLDLWTDLRLLDVQSIIEQRHEMFSRAQPPELRPWIFARSTESLDVLAFDPSQAGDDGEMPVVHLGEHGEGERWPSLVDLLEDLSFRRMTSGTCSGQDLTCLWTNLWCTWSSSDSPRSRGFTPAQGPRAAGADGLFAPPWELTDHPHVTDEELRRVDRRFVEALASLGDDAPKLAFVLTTASAEEVSTHYYVYYEPTAWMVIALDPVEGKASLIADARLWSSQETALRELTESIEQRLHEGAVADALVLAIDEACALRRRLVGTD